MPQSSCQHFSQPAPHDYDTLLGKEPSTYEITRGQAKKEEWCGRQEEDPDHQGDCRQDGALHRHCLLRVLRRAKGAGEGPRGGCAPRRRVSGTSPTAWHGVFGLRTAESSGSWSLISATPSFLQSWMQSRGISSPGTFEILVGSSEERIVEQNRILESFLQYHVAGAIVVSAGSDETAGEELRAFQRRAPIVLVDRDVRKLSCSKVLLRNELAARQLVGLLYKSGHRRIGILAPSTALSIGLERIAGVRRKRCTITGCRPDPEMVFVGDMFTSSGEKAADYFLRMDERSRPTAILSCSDVMTIGLLRGLARSVGPCAQGHFGRLLRRH